MKFQCQYVVDEQNRRVAVQLDIDTFEKIEKILEDHVLYKHMSENDPADPPIDHETALKIYTALEK